MPFTAPTYPTNCPNCGAALVPVALDPMTAPWLCNVCQIGFWPSELQKAARQMWRTTHQCFRHGAEMDGTLTGVWNEAVANVSRGTSLQPEQISIAPDDVLQQVELLPNVDPDFLAQVQAELTNRGLS